MFRINLTTKKLEKQSKKLGGLDGLANFQNGFFVSSNPTGDLYFLDENESLHVKKFEKGLADISVRGDVLYAPFMRSGKVKAFRVNEK